MPRGATRVRLDVAGFVGFAERGPLDVPVAVEDINQYRRVFGGDVILATDRGIPVYANLPGAVQAFFDNGGRRCYVVRVAGPQARPTRWRVPGIGLWQPDGTVESVYLRAAWPGSWSTAYGVGTQLLSEPLAVVPPYRRAAGGSPGVLGLTPGSLLALQPGDLVRLDLGPALPGLYVTVDQVDRAGSTVKTRAEVALLTGPASPPDSDAPDLLGADAVAELPGALPVRAATRLRLDLVAREVVAGAAQLVERWTALGFNPGTTTSWLDVVQPADDDVPDPSRSMLLRADADRLTVLAPEPKRLHGIHALLGVEEVALASVPDAVHVAWSPPVPSPSPAAPPPPPEPAPPDWSHFRDCVVPAAPAPPAPAVPPDPPDPPEAQYPVLDDPAGHDPAGLLEVHTALVQLCAARSDMFAVLGVPRHFDTAAVLTWLQQLTTAARPSQAGRVVMSPLSFAGFWHPWVRVVEPSTPGLAPLREQPADGPVCGMIAARELARGMWVAPARVPLRGPVALARTVSAGDAVRLFDAHANLLQTQPGTISSLSAHTLAAEPTLQQVSVRRLLIVLRKVALLEGGRYVFDTNTERFRQLVRLRFERLLSALTRQGALAAYQVVTGEGTNTAADIDNGRLIVTLRVAPTSPIEFITVNLVRAGEGLLDVVLG